ncbi:MAG TPA: DUF2865 domain-containing protein, partial [Xanthobacteraceae bacterium]|nr:DUF2865 domain-containing protein [Xanthobacteraceae bacterium]
MVSRLVGKFGFAAMVTVAITSAQAQGVLQDQSQTCIRLESQLAALDRAGDASRLEQVKRYEEAIAKQQEELDRTVAQARRMGCEGSGFFLFGGQPPQCADLTGQIQRMRASLDRATADFQRLQGGGANQVEQRRGILYALAQNNCGPQYRNAAPSPPPARQPNFLESLFGGGGSNRPGPDFGGGIFNPEVPQSSTYRTLCVRSCDGFYFPISFATV